MNLVERYIGKERLEKVLGESGYDGVFAVIEEHMEALSFVSQVMACLFSRSTSQEVLDSWTGMARVKLGHEKAK